MSIISPAIGWITRKVFKILAFLIFLIIGFGEICLAVLNSIVMSNTLERVIEYLKLGRKGLGEFLNLK